MEERTDIFAEPISPLAHTLDQLKEQELCNLCQNESPSLNKIKNLINGNMNIRESQSLIFIAQNEKALKMDNFIEIVQLLISHGINVNGKDSDNRNVLHLSCQHYKKSNLPDLVQLLIKTGVEVNDKDNRGENALFYLFNSSGENSLKEKVARILYRFGIAFHDDRSLALHYFPMFKNILNNASVFVLLKSRALSHITLGWHRECITCNAIMSIKKKSGTFQHHCMFLNTVRVFRHIFGCLQKRMGESVPSTVNPTEWLLGTAIVNCLESSDFRTLEEISIATKDIFDSNNFDCRRYEAYLRSMRRVAEAFNLNSYTNFIDWVYLLPFDEISFQEEEFKSNWDRILSHWAHPETKDSCFYGEKFIEDAEKYESRFAGKCKFNCHE